MMDAARSSLFVGACLAGFALMASPSAAAHGPNGISNCDDAITVADMTLDATFSSPEIALSVTTNRISGLAPLAVFFDATGTTHTDPSIEPFLDLHYQWYFHDSDPYSGGTWQYSCKSKQVAAGPMAAHVFDQPGQYPVRLAVRDRSGNTTSTTVIITVESPETLESYCVADIAGRGGDFTGCPLDGDADGTCDVGGRCLDTDDVVDALSGRLGTGVRVLFRRGDVFTAATLGVTITGDTGVLGAFGSPGEEQPTWQFQETVSDTMQAFYIRDASNWRIMDIDLVGDPNSEHSGVVFDIVHGRDVLLYRISSRNWRAFAGASHQSTATWFSENVFVVDFAYRDQLDPGWGWAAFLELESSAVMGLLIEDTSTSEGGYRSMHSRKWLLQHSRIQRPAPFKQNISIRTCEHLDVLCTAELFTEEIVISDNVIVATALAGAMNVTAGPQRRYIVERNFVYNDSTVPDPAGGAMFSFPEIDGVVFRNNILDSTIADSQSSGEVYFLASASGQAEVYNNTFHWQNDGAVVVLCYMPGGGICANNLLYSPGAAIRVSVEGTGTSANNLADEVDYSGSPFPTPVSFPPLPQQFATVGSVMPLGPNLPSPSAIDDFFGHIRPVDSISVGAAEYGLEGSIFSDGFENGSTSNWWASQP